MRPGLASALACLAACGSATPALAQSAVSLAPPQGHPGLAITVSGTGFGASEAVDVYVDTVDSVLLVSSATGALAGPVTIPASASPGVHTITAIGRRSGDAAQTPFTVSTSWAQYGFGVAHAGFNPYENTLTPSTVASLGQAWSVPAGSGDTPAVIGGKLYVGTAGGVEALSSATGSVLWSKLPSEAFYGSPAVVGGALYIGSTAGNVYALNAANGATKWIRALGGAATFYASPVVAGGVVYVGAQDGKMYALQASTGAVIWSYATGSGIDGSVALVNGALYFGSEDDKVYSLNASSGELNWSYTTGGPVESTPAVVNNVLYIGSDDSKVYAFTASGQSAGSLRWSYTTGGAAFANPAVANGIVYAGSVDGGLYALDARTGALRWKLATGGLVRPPSVAGGVVYATSSDGTFYAVAASYGGILASAGIPATYFGAPAVADGVVYVNSFDGNLTAFGLLAGNDARPQHLHAPRTASLHPDLRLRLTR